MFSTKRLAPTLNIDWTRVTVQDLRAVWDLVAEKNEAAGDKLIQRISTAIEQLQRHPNLGRPGRIPETRKLIFIETRYVASYRIIRREIQVLAILHGARTWPDSF